LSSTVWIVNRDHWPRAYLRAELIERGYDAIGFVTLKDAVVRLMLARSRRPFLLVIDAAGQVLDDRLRAVLIRERVPVLAIADAAGDAQEAIVPAVKVIRRPLTIGAIADAVDDLSGRAMAVGTSAGEWDR
jgi:hypothetical protein